MGLKLPSLPRLTAEPEVRAGHEWLSQFVTRESWFSRPPPSSAPRFLDGLANPCHRGYCPGMSTVTEIKQAVSKLPPRKRLALAQWLQAQVDDRLSDDEMMAVAAEGARALDKREAAYAKRKTR